MRDLARSYGPVRAADGISFAVGDGEIFALAPGTRALPCAGGGRRVDSRLGR